MRLVETFSAWSLTNTTHSRASEARLARPRRPGPSARFARALFLFLFCRAHALPPQGGYAGKTKKAKEVVAQETWSARLLAAWLCGVSAAKAWQGRYAQAPQLPRCSAVAGCALCRRKPALNARVPRAGAAAPSSGREPVVGASGKASAPHAPTGAPR